MVILIVESGIKFNINNEHPLISFSIKMKFDMLVFCQHYMQFITVSKALEQLFPVK